jgi:deoxyribodipyrimidine photo-lyase
MPSAPTIMWFRQDLRVSDNPALAHACASGGKIIALYIFDEVSAGPWTMGAASRWWLHHSLTSLAKELEQRGAKLTLRRGAAADLLKSVIAETGAKRVVTSRCYEPWARALETLLHDDLDAAGVEFKRFAGSLLFEPDMVKTKTETAFKVFTPFWRAVSGTEVRQPIAAPGRIDQPAILPPSDNLSDWQLLPTKPDWAGGLRDTWRPGETYALENLDTFLGGALGNYTDKRNRPDIEGTSRLSPHLHFGEISPATCWHRARDMAKSDAKLAGGLETFLKELVWREFSYHLLFHWPSLPDQPFRREFARFPWSGTDAQLQAWKHGRTGYPIVDAGMRQLWATGWMHNRVRMITASFLIKHLLISWREGALWFWDCLVDADLASNSASWQWVAGSGADAAPYFRIFNPQKQGETFDPDGAYVRHWVPEIARLPNQYLHAPWSAPSEVLAAAGITLGKTYPKPIVDHAQARAAALAAFAGIKGGIAAE